MIRYIVTTIALGALSIYLTLGKLLGSFNIPWWAALFPFCGLGVSWVIMWRTMPPIRRKL